MRAEKWREGGREEKEMEEGRKREGGGREGGEGRGEREREHCFFIYGESPHREREKEWKR